MGSMWMIKQKPFKPTAPWQLLYTTCERTKLQNCLCPSSVVCALGMLDAIQSVAEIKSEKHGENDQLVRPKLTEVVTNTKD